ncbi:aldehyde dehydrogenase [Pseudomonas sp. PIC25]|uniref:PA2169 family four-helix-bundle protein n=1 Tax=Pseudomonas sp. PIC25 TaxID=1958773 RepID=UPI000BAB3F86|nr:PA2169 family four-helix-bundle protein [Pseudomonas sp. PIC25]PAU64825.1 aldehyde dehydrogenase [Pseudomonas sp. PIC25]
MDNKDVISVLNDLIETCKDGEKGFRECAEGIRNTQLKSTFSQRALGCAEAARELQEMVRSLGGEPETHSSIAGNLHRRWVDLKSMITGKSDEAILNECERGEDVALKAYREALEKDLPANVRLLVEKQYQGVQRNHDEVKALRNLARAS